LVVLIGAVELDFKKSGGIAESLCAAKKEKAKKRKKKKKKFHASGN